ncbi:unnamed protein product, partial [Ectocarpus sp. 6 AP-2014]
PGGAPEKQTGSQGVSTTNPQSRQARCTTGAPALAGPRRRTAVPASSGGPDMLARRQQGCESSAVLFGSAISESSWLEHF